MKYDNAISPNSILLIYNNRVYNLAPTLIEYVREFVNNSIYKIWPVNTEYGFPKGLNKIHFPVLILHYSLFAHRFYTLNTQFLNYIKRLNSYNIAIFQDEHCFCKQRFDFIKKYNINCIYTLLEPHYANLVYSNIGNIDIKTILPGYVSENLVLLANKYSKPDNQRTIDIGYRGRELPFYWGKGGQEKSQIAVKFLERTKELGLIFDIETREDKRIYGLDWYKFLGNCKGCLGVEAGVSIFDLDDTVFRESEVYLAKNPMATFDDIYKDLLYKWEDNIYYRTISPRHFEAAAFRVCQILYEGKYSGIMKPMVHYIPLKKDFSNLNEVIALFKNENVRKDLTENAYRDLIASGRYSYKAFVKDFDEDLVLKGFIPVNLNTYEVKKIQQHLSEGEKVRWIKKRMLSFLFNQFPGKRFIFKFIKPWWEKYMKFKKRA
ncbi:MAG: hypothetical protein NUV48_10640 [Peptococcaceae bacterium]|jgi:hypothetical protein|nr:hypothetical protein [Peptococcaceae bacterium]